MSGPAVAGPKGSLQQLERPLCWDVLEPGRLLNSLNQQCCKCLFVAWGGAHCSTGVVL